MQTVESFYLLWRLTGDEKWRDRGWAVFEAIEREARTSTGYATVQNVELSVVGIKDGALNKKDEMPSFFLAETCVDVSFLDVSILLTMFRPKAQVPLPPFQRR